MEILFLGNTTSLKDCNGATFCSPSKRTGMSSYLVDGENVRKKDFIKAGLKIFENWDFTLKS